MALPIRLAISLFIFVTSSRMFRLRGAKCYGILPLVLSTELATSIHGDAERIPVDQFETGIRIFYESLVEVAAR